MKKSIVYLFLITLFVWGCTEDRPLEYNLPVETIYFNYETGVETINRSFITIFEDTIVVNVTVKCSGVASANDRYFEITSTDSSTAKSGIDYDPLADKYLFPANEYSAVVPIVIHRTRTLADTTLALQLEIKSGFDFVKGDFLRQKLSISFNDFLSKPSNWSKLYFLGTYSKAKHRVFLQLTGLTQFPTDSEISLRTEYYYYIFPRIMKTYLEENVIYDEFGVRVTI